MKKLNKEITGKKEQLKLGKRMAKKALDIYSQTLKWLGGGNIK